MKKRNMKASSFSTHASFQICKNAVSNSQTGIGKRSGCGRSMRAYLANTPKDLAKLCFKDWRDLALSVRLAMAVCP